MTKSLKVEGMHCEHCAAAVTAAVSALQGISGVQVDLAGKSVAYETDGTTPLETIKKAIEDQGYDVL
jgi:copper ion binding protein